MCILFLKCPTACLLSAGRPITDRPNGRWSAFPSMSLSTDVLVQRVAASKFLTTCRAPQLVLFHSRDIWGVGVLSSWVIRRIGCWSFASLCGDDLRLVDVLRSWIVGRIVSSSLGRCRPWTRRPGWRRACRSRCGSLASCRWYDWPGGGGLGRCRRTRPCRARCRRGVHRYPCRCCRRQCCSGWCLATSTDAASPHLRGSILQILSRRWVCPDGGSVRPRCGGARRPE